MRKWNSFKPLAFMPPLDAREIAVSVNVGQDPRWQCPKSVLAIADRGLRGRESFQFVRSFHRTNQFGN